MPDAPIIAFSNYEVVRITDFTPGIFTGTDYAPIYSTEAPLGSASKAVRCYARQDLGLCPAPTYTPYYTIVSPVGTQYLLSTVCDIQVLPSVPPYPPNFANFPIDAVCVSFFAANQSANFLRFNILLIGPPDYLTGTVGLAATLYATSVGYNTVPSMWPNLVKGWISGGPSVVLASHDPTFPNTTIGFTQSEAGTGQITRQLIANNVSPVGSTYAGGRWAFMTRSSGLAIGSYLLNAGPTQFWTSNIQATTGIVGGEYFFPEYAATIGSWGSISVGEMFFAMSGGGGFLLYGDLQLPSSAVNLPGVQSTGSAIGEAVPTISGLVYCTDQDGAWMWNGGNASQKMSLQIPDNVFLRTPPATLPNVGGPSISLGPNYRNGVWGPWVLFANNYMYDLITNSWWQIEDPAVYNFQVWAGATGAMSQFFWGTNGMFYTAGTGASVTPSITIYKFDKNTPQTSYQWVSNPIPAPGSNVMVGAVEIVASNNTATPSTITVTPTAPPSHTPYANQNPSPVVFTIPPMTASYRAAQSIGWNDYSMCVSVVAANSSTSAGAPFLHSLALGYEPVP